ncbi:Wee1-like protein kinase [Trichinella spiralis]|uniref:Wee1-like protein kinase n=1 Tax=Trichinella spiralis TaxID=6334 RepID=A0ABR3K0P6_TRISP
MLRLSTLHTAVCINQGIISTVNFFQTNFILTRKDCGFCKRYMEKEEIGNFQKYTEIDIDVSLEKQTKTFNDTVFIQKVFIKAAAVWPVRDVSKERLPKSEAPEQSHSQMKQFENDTSCDEFFEENYGQSCTFNFTFDDAKENNGKSKVQWKIPLVEEETENKISINCSSKEPKPILKPSTLRNPSVNFGKIDNGKFSECKSENFFFSNLICIHSTVLQNMISHRIILH